MCALHAQLLLLHLLPKTFYTKEAHLLAGGWVSWLSSLTGTDCSSSRCISNTLSNVPLSTLKPPAGRRRSWLNFDDENSITMRCRQSLNLAKSSTEEEISVSKYTLCQTIKSALPEIKGLFSFVLSFLAVATTTTISGLLFSCTL